MRAGKKKMSAGVRDASCRFAWRFGLEGSEIEEIYERRCIFSFPSSFLLLLHIYIFRELFFSPPPPH